MRVERGRSFELGTLFSGICRKCGKKGHKAKFYKSGKSGTKKKFEGTCNWCGKVGHKEKQCFAKKRREPRTVSENSNNAEDEEVLACMCEVVPEAHAVQKFTEQRKNDCESWLADSGASLHLTNDYTYMRNRRKVRVAVRVSNGDTVTAKVRGDVELKVGKGQKIILHDILYVYLTYIGI